MPNFFIDPEQSLAFSPIEQIVSAETVEIEAYLDMYAAAPAYFKSQIGMSTARFGRGACFAIKDMPTSLFNRFLTNTDDFQQEENAIAATAWLTRHANPAWSIGLAGFNPKNIPPATLTALNLGASGAGMAKFFRNTLLPAYDAVTDIEIREVKKEGAEDFATVVAAAFGLPETYQIWFKELPGRPRWRTYVGYSANTPVAVGALFMQQPMGWCGIGATLPGYRNKGAQSALLARRINDARAALIESLAVDTGNPQVYAQTGPSYRNIVRAGFHLSHVRRDYIKVHV